MSGPDPKPERRLQLSEKVIEMLFERDPDWRKRSFRPGRNEMEQFAEDAELVLRAVDSHLHRQIHAYQLFAPKSSKMGITDIAGRFKEFGWTEGMRPNTLRPLITTLLGHAEKEVSAQLEAFARLRKERLRDRDLTLTIVPAVSTVEFFVKLNDGVGSLLENLGLPDVVTDPDSLQRAVSASVLKLVEVQLDRSDPRYFDEDPTASLAVQGFMKYVCGAYTVEDYIARGHHYIRPHELFLFASQQGYSEEKLIRNVRLLNEGTEVELLPSEKSSLSILETHGGLDEDIDAWMRKNDPQGVKTVDRQDARDD